MATTKQSKKWRDHQESIAKSVGGLKPKPKSFPPGDRERILFSETLSARSWKDQTKKRVALVIAGDHPTSPAKLVELFESFVGSDKLPYFYVSGVTDEDKGPANTRFGVQFGCWPRVRPEAAGLDGYTQEEEERRIAVLEEEHRAIANKYGIVKLDRKGRRRRFVQRARPLTDAEWEDWKQVHRELQEEAAKGS